MFKLTFRSNAWLLLGTLNTAVTLLLFAECSGQEISFREQVQPLLANKCMACHGPDENGRKADLRLDTEEGAKDYAIEPGDANGSELIARIESDDPDVVMPPPGHGEPFTDDERKLLRDWIDQGAPWQGHWAFEPIERPDLPVDDSGWSRNEVDRFVRKRMQAEGLSPSEQADDRTLLRRVYLDLIGLPPTPEQVQQFLSDRSADRFEKVVDQLLRSSHYGEQMAVSWLDIARYADTNGFQNDFNRSMWVWRDWVIDAYNRNMPIDEFIMQQVAGDMLPSPTTSQLIASGFNRNNPTVTEAGSIEEEWQIENCVERADTTATAFLGLTMGCARCHDHKYDPVSQNEFFEFFAFFNNVDERGVYEEQRGNVGPMIKVSISAEAAAIESLDEQIAELNRELEVSKRTDAVTILQQWRTAVESIPSDSLPLWAVDDATVDASKRSPAGKVLELNGSEGVFARDEVDHLTFERDQPFSWTCWVDGDARGAIFGKLNDGAGYRGVDTLILEDGRLKVHLISSWSSNAVAVLSRSALPSKWNHVAVTYTGNSKADGFKIYLDGKPVETVTEVDNLTETTVTDVPFKIGQRSNSSFLTGMISKFSLYGGVLTDEQVALNMKRDIVEHMDSIADSGLSSGGDGPAAQDAALTFVARSTDRYVVLSKLEKQREELVNSQQTTMIMRERPGDYRPSWRLDRGQYDQPDKSVDLWPGVPAVLPPLAEDQPKNRLGLARWLIDDRNPLVARVLVNRVWMKYFGRGLVDPPDNFGIQGAPPSHPELLDWLAYDFRTHGWDLKRLHRQIVSSATYQQASDLTPQKLQRDRENKWLSRGPRYRMTAEQIRDNALLVSGLLDATIGGPAVFPYQPDGLWQDLAGGAGGGPYRQSVGGDLYRRSLYTYRKRTVPHPTTSTFDAPSWETCQVKRSKTNTPLQALALLNDTTYVEAAKKFAERMLNEGGETIEERIEFAMVAATCHSPTVAQKQTLKEGFDYYSQFYHSQPEEAERLLAIGESTVETSNPAELAAMTSIASIILNLDTTVTKE